jgi:hypothetical protein
MMINPSARFSPRGFKGDFKLIGIVDGQWLHLYPQHRAYSFQFLPTE